VAPPQHLTGGKENPAGSKGKTKARRELRNEQNYGNKKRRGSPKRKEQKFSREGKQGRRKESAYKEFKGDAAMAAKASEKGPNVPYLQTGYRERGNNFGKKHNEKGAKGAIALSGGKSALKKKKKKNFRRSSHQGNGPRA